MEMLGRTKFCLTSACVTQRHDSSKFKPQPGLYIRVPRKLDQCFCSPFLPDSLFSSQLSSEFLAVERSVQDWTTLFNAILAEGTTVTAESWEARQVLSQRAKAFKTPKKTVKGETEAASKSGNIANELRDIRNATVDGSDPSNVNNRLDRLEKQMEVLGDRLEAYSLDQRLKRMETIEELETLATKIIDLEAFVGKPSSDISDDAEPTVWATLGSLIHNTKKGKLQFQTSDAWKRFAAGFKALESRVTTDRKVYDDFVQGVVKLLKEFKEDLLHLNRLSKTRRGDINSLSSPSQIGQNLFGSIQDPNLIDMSYLSENYKDLDSKLNQLNETVKAFSTQAGEKQPEAVKFGNLTFSNKDDLKIWILDNTNEDDGSFPFGVFLDVYSFLARIQTYGESKETMLKNLELNQRTKLTSDEVTNLASFTSMLPSIFGKASGNSAFSSTKKSFLPALREKEDWETKSREGGVKRVIEDQIKNVLCQMRDLISARLQGRSEAIMLASTCLTASQAFVIDLSRFISDTHSDLELSGFPKDASWLLVTKLVVRIFGTDLDRVRSFMRGKMDTLDHAQLATDALWATLRTLAVMQEYQKHGIENHPAISAEYVRFLVTHSA